MKNPISSAKNIKVLFLIVLVFGFFSMTCLFWMIPLPEPQPPPPPSPKPEENDTLPFLPPISQPPVISVSKYPAPPPHHTSDTVPHITYEMPQSSDLKLWSGSWFHPDETSTQTSSERWRQCVQNVFPDFPSVNSFNERPVIIYTWHTLKDFLYIHQPSVLECPVKCLFVSDLVAANSCYEEVDSFIIHPPTMNRKLPKKKLPHQSFTLFCTESEHNYPVLNSPEFRNQFDINMTYHIADQVPFTYFIAMDYYMNYYPFTYPKPERVAVMMMISNCHAKNRRAEYLKQLSKFIQIDSYGRCMKNKDIPEEMSEWPWYEVKWNLTARYKFVISFENSIDQDYVSEKLFHSFIAGSVPIYWGAPNIDQFLPAPKSIIKMTDFKTPRDLANFIMYLDSNDTAYFEYLQWKESGTISQEFLRLENTSPRTGPCRLCIEVARRQRELYVKQRGTSFTDSATSGPNYLLNQVPEPEPEPEPESQVRYAPPQESQSEPESAAKVQREPSLEAVPGPEPEPSIEAVPEPKPKPKSKQSTPRSTSKESESSSSRSESSKKKNSRINPK